MDNHSGGVPPQGPSNPIVFHRYTHKLGIMRSLIVTLMLAVGSGCTAQVVLTNANSSPQPGDVYVRHFTADSFWDPPPTGGPIPTYNYTSFGSGWWVDTLRYTAPTDTLWYSGLVPGANAEQMIGDGWEDANGFYYSGTDAGLDVVDWMDLGALYTMSSPMTTLVYPCAAGTTWSGWYSGHSYGGYSLSGEYTVTGSTECHVVTPAGTFSNVLRLTIEQSMDYGNGSFPILHRERSIVLYRKPGLHHPVLCCVRSTGFDSSGNPAPGLYGEWSEWLEADQITGIQPIPVSASSWSLVQNPVEDLLRVTDSMDMGTSAYRIRTADGRLVREGAAKELHDGVQVGDLPCGVYLLQCGEGAVRFIKE